MKPKIYHKNDLLNRELLPGSSVNFIHSENMTLAEWHFESGINLPEHSHPHEQITKIISGEFELKIDNDVFKLTTGSVAVIPSGSIHSAKSISDCHVFDVFNPVRDDYR